MKKKKHFIASTEIEEKIINSYVFCGYWKIKRNKNMLTKKLTILLSYLYVLVFVKRLFQRHHKPPPPLSPLRPYGAPLFRRLNIHCM